MQRLDNQHLNDKVSELADDERFTVKGLEGTGKAVPYMGFGWRSVDFDSPINLGDNDRFIGFMENNKWGYDEWVISEEQTKEVRDLVSEVVRSPSNQTLQRLYDYLQKCAPEGMDTKGRAREVKEAIGFVNATQGLTGYGALGRAPEDHQ